MCSLTIIIFNYKNIAIEILFFFVLVEELDFPDDFQATQNDFQDVEVKNEPMEYDAVSYLTNQAMFSHRSLVNSYV